MPVKQVSDSDEDEGPGSLKAYVPKGSSATLPLFTVTEENTVDDDMSSPNYDMFQITNVEPIKSTIPTRRNEKVVEQKYEEVFVDKVVRDKWVDDATPLQQRPIKVNMVQRFVT